MTTSTAFPPTRVARGVAEKTEFKNLGGSAARARPVRVAVVGQGGEGTTYATTKRQVFSASEVGTLYGFDSPLYQAVLSLLPPNGDGVGDIPVTVYPLAQPTVGGVQAAGTITPSGVPTAQQTYYVKVSNTLTDAIVVPIGSTVAETVTLLTAAVNAVLGMPGTASDDTTNMGFEVGWEGASGNDVYLEVVSPDDAQISFAVVQPTGGAGTVDVNPVAGGQGLVLMGNVWETHVLNCLQYTDSTQLDKYSTHNEGRWLPTVHKPYITFTGANTTASATVTAVTDARKTDRTNAILTNPGSNDLPLVVAADQLRRIAKLANESPSHDYGSQDAPRLTPGPDEDQWDDERDAVVKLGCSTIEVKDGVVNCSDTVTCYHPVGEEPPAYRYCVDIEKIAAVIYNTDLIFNTPAWDGAPLIPNDQATTNPLAKKPKQAEAAIYAMYDQLALAAIIADPDFAKENSSADIDGANPKRLNVEEVLKIVGNTNVISVDIGFGFNYGG